MPWTGVFWLRTFQEPSNFWAMLTAITTIVLASVAYKQLSDLATTSRSDFLYKLKKDFFTERARRLVFLVENGLLEFRDENIPYFQVVTGSDPHIQSRLAELGITDKSVSAYLVDDFLLGPLEDVGIFLKTNQISMDEAYEQFDSYAQMCFDDSAMRLYLDSTRLGEGNEDVYDGIRYLHDKMENERPKIRAKKKNKKIAN